jgi:protein gp37
LSRRYGWGEYAQGVPRQRTTEAYWKQPLKWNMAQGMALDAWQAGAVPEPEPWRVFCASLADVFDNEVPSEWRYDLWRLIEATPNLSWLLVTKRVGNVVGMIPVNWEKRFPDHVRLLITVCNEEEAQRDVRRLLALPCKNGISYEPALGPVDWSPWLHVVPHFRTTVSARDGEPVGPTTSGWIQSYNVRTREPILPELQWVICGGESTQGAGKARPMHLSWATSTRDQCSAAGVPFFFKQGGSNVVCTHAELERMPTITNIENAGPGLWRKVFKDRAGADPAEWPEDLRVQCFPDRGEG